MPRYWQSHRLNSRSLVTDLLSCLFDLYLNRRSKHTGLLTVIVSLLAASDTKLSWNFIETETAGSQANER